MKAIIIPFHNYNITGDDLFGKLLLSYVQRNLERYNAADVIYLVGNERMFQSKVEQYGKTRVEYISTECGSFNDNFLAGVDRLKSGDKFILMDSDLMVYDFTLIDDLFRDLETYDLINCVDTGTRRQPTYDKFEDKSTAIQDGDRNLPYNLWIMRPTEFRRGRTRFTHWIFACDYDFFKKHSDDFNDGNYEAFEPFTRSIAKNDPYARIKELPEIRNNILIHEDNTTPTININSDDIRNTDELVKNSKYYHIRNFGALAQASSSFINFGKFMHSPFAERNYWEIMRITAWNVVILEKVLSKDACDKYKNLINKVFSELKIQDDLNSEKFINYYREFQQYHRTWLL